MTNKFISFLYFFCSLIMYIMAQHFTYMIPNYWTTGKIIVVTFFIIYECMCIFGGIYLFFKK